MADGNGMNVLFVPVDDLRPEMNCYGQEHVITPHMDSLARDGLLFENAHCQQAVCGPSRASVLSGCRPDTTRIYDLKTMVRDTLPDVVTLPQHFLQHGYETVSIGKVYHHRQDDPQGWSKPAFASTGDWQGRGYLTDEAIEAMQEYAPVRAARGDHRPGVGPAFEAADVDDEGYHDGRDASAAIAELDRLRTLDRPWFLALGFHKPHLPFNAPKRYWDLYDPAALPAASNPFAPEGATPYSLADFGELRGYFGMPSEGPIPEDLARKLVHGYCACVSYMDAQLGRVLAALEERGLRENTIVMLWGDHGWKLGEHASWCKHSNFEIDTRAPLLLSTPGTTGRALRTGALVEFVDMYPTLAELCGLPVPDHCEGASLAPLLDRPDRPWKRGAFSQYPRGDVMGYTVRTAGFRYTEWRDRETGDARARELYDHRRDDEENVNAIDDPALAGVAAEHAALLDAGWRAALPPSD